MEVGMAGDGAGGGIREWCKGRGGGGGGEVGDEEWCRGRGGCGSGGEEMGTREEECGFGGGPDAVGDDEGEDDEDTAEGPREPREG